MKDRLMERNKNPPPFSLEGPGREVPQLRDMALGVAMVVCLLFKGRSFPFFLFFFFPYCNAEKCKDFVPGSRGCPWQGSEQGMCGLIGSLWNRCSFSLLVYFKKAKMIALSNLDSYCPAVSRVR